jgi:hypothetical protein
MNAYNGPPMTLGSAAAARMRLIVWCKVCGHQVEPDAPEMAERHGTDTPVPDWQAARLLFLRQPQRRHGVDRDRAA